jgi:hypothetical protein
MSKKFKKTAFYIVVLIVVIAIATILYFQYFNKAESFGPNRSPSSSSNTTGAYARCSQIPDCKTCGETKTSQDGVCYWCDDKGTGNKSCQVWSNTGNCSSDQKDCGNPRKAAIYKVKNN